MKTFETLHAYQTIYKIPLCKIVRRFNFVCARNGRCAAGLQAKAARSQLLARRQVRGRLAARHQRAHPSRNARPRRTARRRKVRRRKARRGARQLGNASSPNVRRSRGGQLRPSGFCPKWYLPTSYLPTYVLTYVLTDSLTNHLLTVIPAYLCRCFGAPACRVFPDHLRTCLLYRPLFSPQSCSRSRFRRPEPSRADDAAAWC